MPLLLMAVPEVAPVEGTGTCSDVAHFPCISPSSTFAPWSGIRGGVTSASAATATGLAPGSAAESAAGGSAKGAAPSVAG